MAAWWNIGRRSKNRKGGDGKTMSMAGLAALVFSTLAVLAILGMPWRDGPAMTGMLAMLLLLAGGALLGAWRRLRRQWRAREHMLQQLRQARLRAECEAAARARMLAVLSHELRTPISGVLGMAALLRGTHLTPEQASYVENIDASGRLLLSMVNELLEEARLETERASEDAGTVRREPFAPARLVEEVVELLAPRAHARGLEVASFIDPAVRGEWLGDAPKLKQALLNLVGNAIKFTREGGVLVQVKRTDNGLHFAVADTGPGVPAALEDRIFEPFVRLDGADTAREGGAGLGLAITRDLLSRMGATLALDNRPGEGATFHFTLPITPVEKKDGDDRVDTAPGLAGRRLWLVMPDGPTAQALTMYAESLGGTAALLSATALPAHMGEEADIIVDARMAEGLQAALDAHGRLPPKARVWLLLAPEQRIRLHDMLQDARLAGYLLRPLRRRTLIERLLADVPESTVRVAAQRMRATQRQLQQQLKQKEVDGMDDAQEAPLVLLADDDAVNRLLLTGLLEHAGYRVEAFADGAALLERLRALVKTPKEHYPACVVTDVFMPGMDGPELVQGIRALERRHGLAPLPILVLTSYAQDDRKEPCLAAGANDVLEKPVDPETFITTLATLTAGAAPPRSTAGK